MVSNKIEWKSYLEEESAYLDISVPYHNDSQKENVIIFEYELTHKDKIVAKFQKEILALPEYKGMVHIPLSILHPELWTTKTPSLYRFSVNISKDGNCIETLSTQIVFRKYEIQRDVAMLNGEALFLKVMVINPIVEKIGQAYVDNMYYRALYEAKCAGFNAVMVEDANDFTKELGEYFGLLVLQNKDIPKTAILYDQKAIAADEDVESQVKQAVNLCEAYETALKDINCGAFCVSDKALYDDFLRPNVATGAVKAFFTEDNYAYVCRNKDKLYIFTKADCYKAFVNAHPIDNLEKVQTGIFKGTLPEAFVQYEVVTSMINKEDYKVILKPIEKATKFLCKAEESRRNLANDSKDVVPITAYALDENGNIVPDYEGDVHFIPYSSAIIRGKTDYTLNIGIGADKFGNVVAIKGDAKETEKYVLPFKSGIATVLVSGTDQRLTGITAHSNLGSETVYLRY